MKLFKDGHGGRVDYIDLGEYGYVEFEVAGEKVRLKKERGFLMVHVDSLGGVIKVLPRGANQVYIGIER